MKAVVIKEHGGADVLQYTEIPDPEMKANEVLVEVRAVALNRLDVWVRMGMPGIKIPFPHILGNDIAGVVREVGGLVDWVQPGDEVMLQPGVACGHCIKCLGGQDHLCPVYRLLGYQLDGGYAELVVAPAVNVIPKPKHLKWEEAAALPLVMVTAWDMLVRRAQVKRGEDVLIHAAGSGVGSIGIQIAKLFGARVIATAGSEAKLARARELGADEIVDYTREDWPRRVRNLTGGKGADIVFEHTGADTWPGSIAVLSQDGRLITCGATSGFAARTDLRQLFYRHLSMLGSYMGSKADMLEAMKFVEDGSLRAVVGQVLPLAEARRAHELMEDRALFGKLILVPQK